MDEFSFKDIGDRLRWHRDLLGLSQDDYSKLIQTERPIYSHWETGRSRLSLDGALRIREKHGLTLDFLYTGDDNTLPLAFRHALRGIGNGEHQAA
jgi:transcriptional regulator with XRE-family HTH domain